MTRSKISGSNQRLLTLAIIITILSNVLEFNQAFVGVVPNSRNLKPTTSVFVSSLSNRRRTTTANTNSQQGRNGSSASSSSSSRDNMDIPNLKPKKTVLNRTPDEAVSLVRDILRVATEAGIRAGPQRSMQAVRAIRETTQQFVPQLLRSSSTEDFNKIVPKILRTFFEKMGATYVKLGQFVASSPTLFPAEYVTEFQKCLDQTEAVPWNQIKAVIEKELGPINTVFLYVDPKPLASASIAQVHRATLRETNEEVVIKIQKPGIEDYLQADLSFLYIASRIIEYLQPDWERTSLSAVMGDIRISMLEELNFQLEGRNTIEFYQFLQQQSLLSQATAPRVYLQYTTKKVMVLEYLDGVSLLDESTIRNVAGSNTGTEIILTALNIWSQSITTMPWFHADVHAGNLLLLNDGRIGFIDFGIVGRISPKVLNSVNELSTALAFQDYVGMATALCNMGATETEIDINAFAADIERVVTRMNSVQLDVNAVLTSDTTSFSVGINENEITELLLDLVTVTENNGLKLPREFGLLVKQSLYFDRYLKILAPNVDIMNDSRVSFGGVATPNSGGSSTSSTTTTSVEKSREREVIDV